MLNVNHHIAEKNQNPEILYLVNIDNCICAKHFFTKSLKISAVLCLIIIIFDRPENRLI